MPADDILARSWVVIPAYRESEVIGEVISGLRGLCQQIVVVDDGSKDRTGSVALAAGAVVLTHIVNLGQGAALQTGIEYALRHQAQYIFTFDADGQHTPDSLGSMAETMQRTGADVVLGSRWLGAAESMPPFRRLVLKLALVFTRFHSGLNITDTHNGLRLFTAAAAELIRITQPRMAHASELLDQIGALGVKYAETPVTVRYTNYSLRKGQKLSGAVRVLVDIFYSRWTR
jgi:glycosyltransferase involved in cell wall biosynthesis